LGKMYFAHQSKNIADAKFNPIHVAIPAPYTLHETSDCAWPPSANMPCIAPHNAKIAPTPAFLIQFSLIMLMTANVPIKGIIFEDNDISGFMAETSG
jgi:hypothetical protein